MDRLPVSGEKIAPGVLFARVRYSVVHIATRMQNFTLRIPRRITLRNHADESACYIVHDRNPHDNTSGLS